MTTGLKTPNSYYIQLITEFPPRPITNEAELIATQNRINSLLDKGRLTKDDCDYLKVWRCSGNIAFLWKSDRCFYRLS